MAHRDRSRLGILARCGAAAGQFSPQGRDRGGAQTLERGETSGRHERAGGSGVAIAAQRRSGRHHRRARAARDRRQCPAQRRLERNRFRLKRFALWYFDEAGPFRKTGFHFSGSCSNRQTAYCVKARPRVVDQSASLLRPTTDILAAAVTSTPLRINSKFSRAARFAAMAARSALASNGSARRSLRNSSRDRRKSAWALATFSALSRSSDRITSASADGSDAAIRLSRLATSRLICATLDNGTVPAPL